MKRVISLVLIAVMLLALAGCGGKEDLMPKLTGEWVYLFDISDKMTETLAAEDPTLATYFQFKNLTMGMNYTIAEDGSFELTIDEQSAKDMYAKVKSVLNDGFVKYCEDTMREVAESSNMSLEDIYGFYDAENAVEVMEMMMGMSLDEMIEESFSEDMLMSMFDDVKDSGKVTVKGSEITFTYQDNAVDKGTYNADKDTLTIDVDVDDLDIHNPVFSRK